MQYLSSSTVGFTIFIYPQSSIIHSHAQRDPDTFTLTHHSRPHSEIDNLLSRPYARLAIRDRVNPCVCVSASIHKVYTQRLFDLPKWRAPRRTRA